MTGKRQKTSVYLGPEQDPTADGDGDFALARGFDRVDSDPRPISAIPDADLLNGFGA